MNIHAKKNKANLGVEFQVWNTIKNHQSVLFHPQEFGVLLLGKWVLMSKAAVITSLFPHQFV